MKQVAGCHFWSLRQHTALFPQPVSAGHSQTQHMTTWAHCKSSKHLLCKNYYSEPSLQKHQLPSRLLVLYFCAFSTMLEHFWMAPRAICWKTHSCSAESSIRQPQINRHDNHALKVSNSLALSGHNNSQNEIRKPLWCSAGLNQSASL